MTDESNIPSHTCSILFLKSEHGAKGFTIVEMLLAIALSAVVMVAVLGQLGSIRRPSHTPVPAHLYSEARLLALIERDLAKTSSLQAGDGVLTLYTYRALAPDTMAETHRPMTVRYRVVEHAGKHWLVRDQKHFDVERDGQDDWLLRTPLRNGVAKARWSAPEIIAPTPSISDEPEDRADLPALQFDTNRTGPTTALSQAMLPRRIRLEMFNTADASQPTQTLFLASGNLLAQAEQVPPVSGGD